MSVETDAAEVARRFQKLGENATRALERRVLRAAAKIVQERAIMHAPEDTGRLKAGIKVRAGRRSRSRQSVQVVSTVPYAQAQEFTAKYNNAHIRPATDETREQVLQSFARELRRELLEAPLDG